MPDNPILRRLITIPVVVTLFIVVTLLSPLLISVAFVVDLVRAILDGKPWVTTRGVAFLWIYLLGELWALLALAASAPLPRASKDEVTYDLQGSWARWNLRALCRLFSLSISVEGQEEARRGPMLVLSRHASLVDTLLPAHLIANPFRVRLRYVLKRELLVDPALDVAGNRLPNHFLDRSGDDLETEMTAIAALATGLGHDQGVLIFPEGTRFSESKRDRFVARLTKHGGPLANVAAGFQHVLPPRPGGTLTLLDASDADVVVFAHHGLEGLATVRDIWEGGLVGSRIEVYIRRIPRAEIPTGRNDRVTWLFEMWSGVDKWLATYEGRQPDH